MAILTLPLFHSFWKCFIVVFVVIDRLFVNIANWNYLMSVLQEFNKNRNMMIYITFTLNLFNNLHNSITLFHILFLIFHNFIHINMDLVTLNFKNIF